MTKAVTTKMKFTKEQVAEAARSLIGVADSNAQVAAQAKGKGHAMVLYPGEIPQADRLAAELLRTEGHQVGISKGTFANSIVFPGREILLSRG